MAAAMVDHPLASGSEQFGLGRPRHAPLSHDVPSSVGVRPWGLRGMRRGTVTGRAVPRFKYSHEQQVAVDERGRPLVIMGMVDPSADSVTDADGDEGRSEDWLYDFVPDHSSPA